MLLRRPLHGLFYLGSSLLLALGLASGLREVLPYEALGRTSIQDRFLLWEGAVWTVGLVLLLVSAAIFAENIHRLRRQWSHRSDSGDLPQAPRGFLLVPWWMLASGAALIGLAILARAQLPG